MTSRRTRSAPEPDAPIAEVPIEEAPAAADDGFAAMRVRAASRRRVNVDEVTGGEPAHEHTLEATTGRVTRLGGLEFQLLRCACGARAVGDQLA